MNNLLAFLRLTRLINVLILVLLEAMLFYGYFAYYADELSIKTVLTTSEFWVFMLISALLTVGGNVINDIMDVDIDAINKPDKQVVSKTLSVKAAWSLYHVVNLFSFIGILYWYWSTKNLVITIIFVLIGVGMYFYSTWMKRKFLIGNLFVAILCSLPPLLVLSAESATLSHISEQAPSTGLWIISIIGIYSYFAFSTTLYREVVKDIQDIPGDKATGCATMPVLVGGFMAKRIAMVIAVMVTFSVLSWLAYQWPMKNTVNTIAIIVGLVLPLGISILRLYRARSVDDFKSVSKAIKLLMFNGIIYLMIVKILIPSVS